VLRRGALAAAHLTSGAHPRTAEDRQYPEEETEENGGDTAGHDRVRGTSGIVRWGPAREKHSHRVRAGKQGQVGRAAG